MDGATGQIKITKRRKDEISNSDILLAYCCDGHMLFCSPRVARTSFMAFLTILFIPRIKFKWEDDHGKD